MLILFLTTDINVDIKNPSSVTGNPQWQVNFWSRSVTGHPQWPKTPLAHSTASSELLATHSGK